MSSYRNHVKKMTAILLTSTGKKTKVDDIEIEKAQKVVKPKKVKNQLSGLTETEKQNITDADDFHEFINNVTVDDSEE